MKNWFNFEDDLYVMRSSYSISGKLEMNEIVFMQSLTGRPVLKLFYSMTELLIIITVFYVFLCMVFVVQGKGYLLEWRISCLIGFGWLACKTWIYCNVRPCRWLVVKICRNPEAEMCSRAWLQRLCNQEGVLAHCIKTVLRMTVVIHYFVQSCLVDYIVPSSCKVVSEDQKGFTLFGTSKTFYQNACGPGMTIVQIRICVLSLIQG